MELDKQLKHKAMKKFYLTLMALAMCCFFTGCKDDPSVNFPANAVTIKKVYDIGNSANASDIRADLSFDPSVNLTDVEEVRLIVSKSIIKEEVAKALTGNNFQTLTAASANLIGKFDASVKDADGSTIANDVDYKLYAVLTARDEAFFLSTPTNFTLKNKSVYAGDYVGVWNDALFKNFDVTMTLEDDHTGSIFYTKQFTACCGGVRDGTVKFIFTGTTITSFQVNQFLGSYKGGNCEATYTANGVVTDEITLSIANISGIDCDGDHTPGTVKFTRQ